MWRLLLAKKRSVQRIQEVLELSNCLIRRTAAAQPQVAPVAPAPVAVAAAPVAGGITPEKLEMLKNLGELKAQGILSEEEFAAEKTKLLAS